VKPVRAATAVKLLHQLGCQVVVKGSGYNQIQPEMGQTINRIGTCAVHAHSKSKPAVACLLRPLACKAAATETTYIYYSRAIMISVAMCSSSPGKVLRWVCTPKEFCYRLSCTAGCRQCGHNVVKFKILGKLIRCSCRTSSIFRGVRIHLRVRRKRWMKEV